jgi:hypothetical protein
MQLLDLPLEVFRIIIASTVRELGMKQAMKARLVCRMSPDTTWLLARLMMNRFIRKRNLGSRHHD